jgi:hypothetical protein
MCWLTGNKKDIDARGGEARRKEVVMYDIMRESDVVVEKWRRY